MKTLITCHSNADSDSFAAMLAARLLYPGADLLFPGTQEAPLAKTYEKLDKEKYGFIAVDAIKWEEYGRLVVVDTRQTSRVRHAAPLLARAGVRREIWDHHPPSSEDIDNATLHYAQTGAVTSLLCHELEKRKITLTPEYATLLGLGIYGDTGSFTYSSTTEADFHAASWLLRQGMNVTRLNDMACHTLTSIQVQTLNALLESAQTYPINDVQVVLAEAVLPDFLGDFAFLAHKLMELEKFTVLFAIGRMNDRILVVARSREPEVNVGEICAALGGGGHEYAASATVRMKSDTEVREIILRKLHEHAHPEKTARDYMTAPAIGAEATATIEAADELMVHFGLKAIPVFAPGTRTCVGLLDAQMAARAHGHGLGSQPVEEFMQRRLSTMPPGASIGELAQIIVGGRQRLVPIVDEGLVIGVVTRTDLINFFASDSGSLAAIQKKNSKPHNVGKLINERLDRETRDMLRLAGALGENLGLPVYAVGGFVRDLLIGRSNHDIDLVAEGNGIALARELARELGGRVREHQEFLTSVVIYHDAKGVERHIDVATARLEYYEYPAALPTVELSSIKMDLFRRDFSINALAIRLDGGFFGQLQDFFGGRRDIKDKLIRVLHTLSFVEDPTRCIRAVRFEQRYGFRIGPGTEKLMKNILPLHFMEKLSPGRVFNEYKHLCEEECAPACFVRLDGLGILKALDANLTLTPAKKAQLKRVQEMLAWHHLLYYEQEAQAWICYFLALSAGLNYAASAANYKALGLPDNRKAEIMGQREQLKTLWPKLYGWQKKDDQGITNVSQFCDLLRDLSLETLLYAMAAADNEGIERNISRYITRWRREKADINGRDLMRLGIEPGPVYAEFLDLALRAKLNDKAPNAKAQLALVREEWRKRREKADPPGVVVKKGKE